MDYFNDLGRKVLETGQNVLQKTKSISDTGKLNSMISDEERKINNNYLKIGKLYFSIYKNEYEEKFSEMINAIKESEEKIQNYRKEIQDIKGIECCEICGSKVPKDAVFCSSCGGLINKKKISETMNFTKCQNCGAMVSKNMRYCTACGKPIEIVIEGSNITENQLKVHLIK